MKKAILYARVSSKLQEKERAIESQIQELKKQIIDAGDVLVKEYVDDGYSGALLNRPAMDQLRSDLKTNLFDTVFFLNTDRIARDVAYQTIIIAEILKYKKQIIINGKDYVHNPENKFELTVLGAVAELERAKIIERSMRGKQYRLRQGFLLSTGYNVYGYMYVPRSRDIPAKLVINEKEAKIVRYIFETYAEGQASWAGLIRGLENMGAITKMGKAHWTLESIKRILKNHTYAGTRYYNTRRLVKEPSNPLRGIKYGKKVFRDKSEWIGVKVPAIVSQKVFDTAQERIAEGKSRYQKPREIKLLSNLVRCGECGRSFIAYHRYLRHYYKYKDIAKKITGNVSYKIAYKCRRRCLDRVHIKTLDIKHCTNPEVSARVIEPIVLHMIEKVMLQPMELKKCLASTEARLRTTQLRMEKQLKKLEQDEQYLKNERQQILDSYAIGNLDRDMYVERCLWYDNEANKLKLQRIELIRCIPILHKKDVIDVSVRIFCETARARFEKCISFDTKRQFLLDFIEEILYDHGKITVKGSVPIQLQAYADPEQTSEARKIEFSIEDDTHVKALPRNAIKPCI